MHYGMQLPTESGVVVVAAVEFEKNRMLDVAAAVAIDRLRRRHRLHRFYYLYCRRIRRSSVAIY